MFDFIHTDIKDRTVEEILSSPLLDFVAPVSLNTGEINPQNSERKKKLFTPKNEKKAYYKGLTVVVTNDLYINLQGSLHEYFHENNRGDFKISEVKDAIVSLAASLGINPSLTTLHNLEFGVNVILPFPVSTFLNSILNYKGQRPDRNTYTGKGFLIKFYFNQYEVKLYDKGKQHGLNQNILRVEIKVRRMQYLQAKKVPIKTLNDLLNRNNYPVLKSLLLKVIDSIVLSNIETDRTMNKNEKRLFIESGNPSYWVKLWEENPTKYRKKLIQFRRLNGKFDPLKIQSTLLNLVGKKWDELNTKSSTEITEVNVESGTDITAHKIQPKSKSSTDITLQVISNIQPNSLEQRHCKSCGKDISQQKKGSLYCSESLYGAEGKKCRNRNSNPRNNFYKKEKKAKERGLLFDTIPFINKHDFKELSVKYR
jgi:hypothetical protein